ncbi:MAG: DDE-type integrase/transposase/recombinase [Alphaproteobacteria bacterium]|nr:DDE-type integrase/transposase/recombinase [Alphaproteobacteria bacterium]MBP9776893.1 DDE-type integrase/transposase/recombinase [Alphaproteobacteria bacterium]
MAPDLIQQNFKAHEPNEAWVSDITYVFTQEGWIYCAMILDLFSRKIVGLAIDSRHDSGARARCSQTGSYPQTPTSRCCDLVTVKGTEVESS